MEIKEYYSVDPATDTIVSARSARRVVNSDAKLRGCPECRIPLRDIHRYNGIVKKALLDESIKRFIITASSTYKSACQRIPKTRDGARKRRVDFLVPESTSAGLPGGPSSALNSNKSLGEKEKLQKSIDKFTKSMAAAEQPYGRVNDLLASAASREDTVKNSSVSAMRSAGGRNQPHSFCGRSQG